MKTKMSIKGYMILITDLISEYGDILYPAIDNPQVCIEMNTNDYSYYPCIVGKFSGTDELVRVESWGNCNTMLEAVKGLYFAVKDSIDGLQVNNNERIIDGVVYVRKN